MFTFSAQPLPILKVISEGFKLFSQSFSKIWYWSFLFHLISNIPNIIYLFKGQPIDKATFSISDFLLFFLVTIIQVYVAAFLAHRIYNIATAPDSKTIDSFKVAAEKWLTIFLAVLLMGLVLGLLGLGFVALSLKLGAIVGLAIFGIPFLILSLLLIFYLPFILFNQASALTSLKESALLVWGHWWETLLIPLIPVMIGVFLLLFASLIQPQNSLGFILSLAVILSLTKPLFYSLILTQFNNLQRLKNQKGL